MSLDTIAVALTSERICVTCKCTNVFLFVWLCCSGCKWLGAWFAWIMNAGVLVYYQPDESPPSWSFFQDRFFFWHLSFGPFPLPRTLDRSHYQGLWTIPTTKDVGPFPLPRTSPRFTFTWWGCCGLCLCHKPAELARSFLFCSCVCVCLYGPFNCISYHKFSRQLSVSSLCSPGLISAWMKYRRKGQKDRNRHKNSVKKGVGMFGWFLSWT